MQISHISIRVTPLDCRALFKKTTRKKDHRWKQTMPRKDGCNFLVFGVNFVCDKKEDKCMHLSSKVTPRRKMDASKQAVLCLRREEGETHTKNLLVRYFLVDTVGMHVRYE